MPIIRTGEMTDEALIDYDKFMAKAIIGIPETSELATALWGDVLKELDRRKLVKIVSGSFDDIGSSLIIRNYN